MYVFSEQLLITRDGKLSDTLTLTQHYVTILSFFFNMVNVRNSSECFTGQC